MVTRSFGDFMAQDFSRTNFSELDELKKSMKKYENCIIIILSREKYSWPEKLIQFLSVSAKRFIRLVFLYVKLFLNQHIIMIFINLFAKITEKSEFVIIVSTKENFMI